MKPVGTCGNSISKCPDISENMTPLLVHTVLLNKIYYRFFFVSFIIITLYYKDGDVYRKLELDAFKI